MVPLTAVTRNSLMVDESQILPILHSEWTDLPLYLIAGRLSAGLTFFPPPKQWRWVGGPEKFTTRNIIWKLIKKGIRSSNFFHGSFVDFETQKVGLVGRESGQCNQMFVRNILYLTLEIRFPCFKIHDLFQKSYICWYYFHLSTCTRLTCSYYFQIYFPTTRC